MKTLSGVGVLFSLGLILSGCSKSGFEGFSPEKSGIYVSKDGDILNAIVAEYEQKDYYTQEALEAYAKGAVDEYNGKKENPSPLPVSLVDCTMEEGKATLIFDYASGEELVQFASEYEDRGSMVTSLKVSSFEEAKASMEQVSFLEAKKAQAVSFETVVGSTGLSVVMIEGATTLEVDGKVQYVSEGVNIINKNVVETSEGMNYILFK